MTVEDIRLAAMQIAKELSLNGIGSADTGSIITDADAIRAFIESGTVPS